MTQHDRNATCQVMNIHGRLQPSSFLPWIDRRAERLGLRHHFRHADENLIQVELSGVEDLVDMMEVTCLLGPIDVWVERIERVPFHG